jgi:four helix bundle protein
MNAEQMSERLMDFAVAAGRVVDALPDTRTGRNIASQLVRCSTSPLANYEEACAAESRADFIHKTGICLKELRETRVWLMMIARSKTIPEESIALTLDECTQLCNIIAQSIITAKRNSKG